MKPQRLYQHKILRKTMTLRTLLFGGLLLLGGCGGGDGGGGSGSNNPGGSPPESEIAIWGESNWDEAEWQ